MQTKRTKKGFTLAEMMIVIAILLILAALIFVGIQRHLRTLEKLQRDSYAKELFIVAQNHLSMAKAQNYLGCDTYGTVDPTDSGIYYYVVPGDSLTDSKSVLSLMLPPGSIDETVRSGSYVIRYHKESGQILDCFYWTGTGRFPHSYSNSDYAEFLSRRSDADKLKTYTDNSVIGYYGGVTAATAKLEETISAPLIRIENAERLRVIVTDTNSSAVRNAQGYRLVLTVKGENGGIAAFTLTDTNPGTRVNGPNTDTSGRLYYTITLDDVTANGLQYSKLGSAFAPGETVSVNATASNTSAFTNVATSETLSANSLFADGTVPSSGHARIANFRHLENLARTVSGVNGYTSAEQTTDLDWNAFLSGIGSATASVYRTDGTKSDAGTLLPVTPGYALTYDGKNHTISNVKVSAGTGDAGVFGKLTGGSVSNLKLVDGIFSGGNAGALAGIADGLQHITNVLAVDSSASNTITVGGSVSAGGLVGTASNTEFIQCGASKRVQSTAGNAGGLAGTVSGGSEINGCYSGGRTTDGKYSATDYNVTASAFAGGLVGDAGNTEIKNSYSTCSASGATAGGFVGTGAGSFTNSYATGLVKGTTRVGAFAGTLDAGASATNCRYFEIINEVQTASGYTYRTALSSGVKDGITAFDASANLYNAFVGSKDGWGSASAFDSRLKLYYSGKYPLPTVARLLGTTLPDGSFVSVHNGDWPAPELLVVNQPQ
jgi:prepilin-type N-terminal cleavage/methylation domain-containing protein